MPKYITPTNADALTLFVARILLRTYPLLAKEWTLEEMWKDEKLKLEGYFEGNLSAYREYAHRKIKAHHILKA